MLPNALSRDSFAAYPPQARSLAAAHVELLRQLPLAFLPLLLRELIAYDWKFPAERVDLDNQFTYLGKAENVQTAMSAFKSLQLSAALENLDWVNKPAVFSENLTAYLWASHQIDAFRSAAVEFVHKVNLALPAKPLPTSRLAIVVVGAGVEQNKYPLFRKLRPHGVYYRNVQGANGLQTLVEAMASRASTHPDPFGHWYIDGSAQLPGSSPAITCISYDSLAPIRTSLVNKMRAVMQPGGGGPEALRTALAQMTPPDLGLPDATLNRFQIALLTEGSGTQLFSTSFVQWSAREVLRRAQPLTLLARFTPRQHESSMHELLAGAQTKPVPDPAGSLIDADIGAYYTWINQSRLSGTDQSAFLVWFENGSDAVAISPRHTRGSEQRTPISLRDLIRGLQTA